MEQTGGKPDISAKTTNQDIFPLKENLFDTTLLMEETHQRFSSIIEDLTEGISAVAIGLHPDNSGDTQTAKESNLSALLEKITAILNELKRTEEKITDSATKLNLFAEITGYENKQPTDVYRSIFKRVRDGVFIVDSGWNIREANPAICDILGFKYRRLVTSLNIRKDVFVDPEDFELFEKQLLLAGYIQNHETKFSTAAGKEISVVLSCNAIWSEDVVLTGFEGIVRDITEYKRIEEERINMQRLESVHNFVIAINHNINQSLTVIYSFLQIMREQMKEQTKFREYIDRIYSEVERIIELVSKTTEIRQLATTDYIGGLKMLDLEKSIKITSPPAEQNP